MPIVCGGDFGRGGGCLAAGLCMRADGTRRGGGDGGGAQPAAPVGGRGDAPQTGRRSGAWRAARVSVAASKHLTVPQQQEQEDEQDAPEDVDVAIPMDADDVDAMDLDVEADEQEEEEEHEADDEVAW